MILLQKYEVGHVMEKKKRKPLVIGLWLLFIIMVAGIAFLSFQNGVQAKELGSDMLLGVVQNINPQQTVTATELDDLLYQVRQSGRAIAFLLIGMVGTLTIHLSCPKAGWCVKTGITAAILFAIAFLTERLKLYIPTRHYSSEEMMISMAAAAAGFLIVSVITLTVKALKGFFRLMMA